MQGFLPGVLESFDHPDAQHTDLESSYTFSLNASVRDAGTFIGSDVGYFMDRLQAGEPVTVAIIGASVAQNAGCLNQEGRRCMNYNGVNPVQLLWGKPRTRPFKGFLVRWFEWLNRTWPHAAHALVNNGRDAQPFYTLLPCLYAYVPPRANLIFLEVGSMPYAFDGARTEAVVRRLAGLQPRPAIVFVTTSVWCNCHPTCRNIQAYATTLPTFKRQTLLRWDAPYIRAVHNETAAICQHYGVSCLSMRTALEEPAFAGAPGFAISELAADCLHPVSGTRGVDYVTDVLVHWTQRAAAVRAAVRQTAANNRASRQAMALPTVVLPPALFSRATQLVRAPSACFNLETLGSRGTSNGQRLLTIPWHTAFCSKRSFGRMMARSCDALGSGAPCLAADAARAGCVKWDEQRLCDSGWAAADVGPTARSSLPPVWSYCSFALSPSRKESPGVVALVPGATLYLPLDVAFAASTNQTALEVELLHLTSYEGMGIADVRCLAGCRCDAQRIDAHVPQAPGKRNESVFSPYQWRAWTLGDSRSCLLLARLSDDTSSGGFKFKVRSLVARSEARCEMRGFREACS